MKQEGEKEFYSDTEIGTWYYAESTYTDSGKITPTQFKLLEEAAILDHIEELKRHLETRKKERQVA